MRGLSDFGPALNIRQWHTIAASEERWRGVTIVPKNYSARTNWEAPRQCQGTNALPTSHVRHVGRAPWRYWRSFLLQFHGCRQALAGGKDGGLHARTQLELAQNVLHMDLDGGLGDAQIAPQWPCCRGRWSSSAGDRWLAETLSATVLHRAPRTSGISSGGSIQSR